MKKVLLSLCALALLGLGACTNDDKELDQNVTAKVQATPKPMTIEVGRGATTKIDVTQDSETGVLKMNWADNDAIGVLYTVGDESYNEKFTIKEGAGNTSAKFFNNESLLPDLSESDAVDVTIYYPYKEGTTDETFVFDYSSQTGKVADLDDMMYMSKETTVKGSEITGCTLESNYVILKLAKGAKLFKSSASSGVATIPDSLTITDNNKSIIVSKSVSGSKTTTSSKLTLTDLPALTAAEDGDGLALSEDRYLLFYKGKDAAPDLQIGVGLQKTVESVAKGVNYKFSVTRSKALNMGKLYTLPFTPVDYIVFACPVTESICIKAYSSDGIGVTYQDAANAKSVSFSDFQGTEITSFDELVYWTGIKGISAQVFMNCTSLKSITLPEKVASIGMNAFKNCTALESINIPANVTKIGQSAFLDCTSLATLTFAKDSQLTTIDDSAFLGCTSLTSVTIPKTVTTFGSAIFKQCTGLTTAAFEEGTTVTEIPTSMFYECTSLTSFTIPSTVTTIGNGAFGKSGLTGIELPDGLQVIDSGAFSDCTGITSITLPSTLTTINKNAFANISITTLTIPASVTTVGQYAFKSCKNLTTVDVYTGSGTTYGDAAFRTCSKLKTLNCYATTPSTLGESSFWTAVRTVNVKKSDDDSVLNAYKEKWTDYASYVKATLE